MKYLLIGALCAALFSSCMSQAATKITLVDGQGNKVTFDAAVLMASKGEKIYKCQEVKPTVNKSGTSISFKVVK